MFNDWYRNDIMELHDIELVKKYLIPFFYSQTHYLYIIFSITVNSSHLWLNNIIILFSHKRLRLDYLVINNLGMAK